MENPDDTATEQQVPPQTQEPEPQPEPQAEPELTPTAEPASPEPEPEKAPTQEPAPAAPPSESHASFIARMEDSAEHLEELLATELTHIGRDASHLARKYLAKAVAQLREIGILPAAG